jgi:hypothetical protein
VRPTTTRPEVEAISKVARALKPLSTDSRRRVIEWAASRHGVSIGGPSPRESEPFGGNARVPAHAKATASGEEVDPESYEDFAAMFDAAQPRTEVDRTAVACFWVQVRTKKNPFLSQDANTLLKHLGHQVRDITEPFDALRVRSPLLVIQLKKDGSHQQSRKLYRLTPAGLKFVTDALLTGGFSDGS